MQTVRLVQGLLLSPLIWLSSPAAANGPVDMDALLAPSAHPEVFYCTEFGERFEGPLKTLPLDEVVELRSMLEDHRFFELNEALHELQLATEQDLREETVLSSAYDSLANLPNSYTAHFEAWVAASPNTYQGHLALGAHYNSRGWSARGARLYSETSTSQLFNATTLMGLSVESLDRALAIYPNSTVAVAELIDSLKVLGDQARFEEMKRIADSAMPDSYVVNQRLAHFLSKKWGGSVDAVQAFLEDRLRRETRMESTLMLRAGYWIDLAYRAWDSIPLSGRYYQRATYCGNYSKAHFNFAHHMERTRWAYNSPIYYKRAVDANPLDARSHIRLAGAYAVAENLDDAHLHYDIATQISPDARLWDDVVVESFISRADSFLDLGHPPAAVQFMERALEHVPGNSKLLVKYARALLESGRLDDSKVTLQQIFAEDADNYQATLVHLDWFLRVKDRERAIQTLSDFIERNPDEADAWYQRGWVNMHVDDIRAAFPDYLHACKLDERRACKELGRLIQEIVETPLPELYDLLDTLNVQ